MISVLKTRRGMTLIELLVVISIIGLLAVTVAPVFVASPDRRNLDSAAQRLSTHFNQIAARALEKPAGGVSWIEAGAVGGGAVTAGVGRVPTAAYGNCTVDVKTPPGLGNATISPAVPSSAVGGLIEFAVNPSVFTVESTTQITVVTAASNVTIAQSVYNAAIPNSPSTAIPYTIMPPPQKRITTRATRFQDATCIDLGASTIGVHGFTDGTVTSLASYQVLAVVFDNTGKPTTAWAGKPALNPQPSSPYDWDRFLLTPDTPIALMVGNIFQVGSERVDLEERTENNPGGNWQNAFGQWLVIDPKSGRILTIDNQPQRTDNDRLPYAQGFIVKDLEGQ